MDVKLSINKLKNKQKKPLELTSKHAFPKSAILTLTFGLFRRLCSTLEYDVCLLLTFDNFGACFSVC